MKKLLIALLLIAGCAQPTDKPVDKPTSQLTAYCKWGNGPTVTPEWVADKATYDFLAFTPGVWDYPKMIVAAESLRVRNPNINLGTYYSVFTAPQWTKVAYDRGMVDTYAYQWWAAMSPYLAQTTEGDTAAIFLNNYDWDITNPAARAAAIAVLNDYVRRRSLDWVMMDFCSVPLPDLKVWQDPIYQEMEHGDLDFDRDGVGHWDDLDEQGLVRAAFFDYIAELRAALPAGTRVIPNGMLAIYDDEFAHIVDGCYIEGFPQWFFGSVEPNLANALSPEFPRSLWHLTELGHWALPTGYVMVEDKWNSGQFAKLPLFFDGCVDLRIMTSETRDIPTPVVLDFGPPLGLATVRGDTIMREYAEGTVLLRF